jgi:Kef-type K+ transport system membrane component KefB
MTDGLRLPSFAQRAKPYLGYGGLLVLVAVAYLFIRAYGDTLAAPPALTATAEGGAPQLHVNDFLHVLLALVLVIASARGLGGLFRLVKQPPVVGEMIAGILLGPSLLGHFAPGFSAYILPHSVAPLLNGISQVGVILYMFMVGLEMDVSGLKTRAHATITISHSSIVTPFLLGAALALLLYPRLSTSDVSFTAFSLFLGVSMSVTAFPVLARILTDRGIQHTKMGTLTLACAAIDDVSAWCLLAFVVSVTQSHAGHALPTLLMAVGYIAVMLMIVRPLVIRLTNAIGNKGRLTQGVLAFVLLAILLSSLTTESIGIHAIFGAFVLGAIVPHESMLAKELTAKLEDFVIVFLLPAFFASTGLRTQIGLVTGPRQWFFCALIILIASIGKFGGSALAARFSGLTWRDASALGVLMNTRGLMELIVLNIGLELHVISPTLFAMLVLMALATTFATTPILQFIMPQRKLEEEVSAIAAASRLAAQTRERTGTLIPVSNPAGVATLLDLALKLSPPDAPPPRVLALLRGGGTSMHITDVAELKPSRSPLLAAALDAAWSRGRVITPKAIWTTDAAAEIVQAAEDAQVRWLLLESRRTILGRYPRGSVVSRVLKLTQALPVSVAVLLQTPEPIAGPITCLLKAGIDARSALEMAAQLAGGEKITVLFARQQVEAESAAEDEAEASLARTLPAQFVWSTIVASAGHRLMESLPKGLVIVGKDVVDGWQLGFDQLANGRNIILIQGAGVQAGESSVAQLRLQTASA